MQVRQTSNIAKIPIFILLIMAHGLATAQGIWITPKELQALPMSGSAWTKLKKQADSNPGTPNIKDQNQHNNVYVLAKALVYARTGVQKYRTEVIDQCMKAIGTEKGGTTLALGRELAAYVISADLVGMPSDKDKKFRTWLRTTLTEVLDGRTLQSTHEKRPNNWGTHAGASRAAVAAYLGDQAELDRTAQVFEGWLGDRSVYAGFKFGDLSWQCDAAKPVGVNPKGCKKSGHSIDGVLPDDQRRSGKFSWPPPKANYVYGALGGALVQAVILWRSGYNVFDWSDQAVLRAYQWLLTQADFYPEGDDDWHMPLVDHIYGTNLWDGGTTNLGKNMAWTDWTHSN